MARGQCVRPEEGSMNLPAYIFTVSRSDVSRDSRGQWCGVGKSRVDPIRHSVTNSRKLSGEGTHVSF